jgi:hypothetical protein
MLGACTSEPNTKSENDSLVVIIKQCTFPDSPKEKAPSWVCDGKVPGLVVQAMGLSANKLAGIGHQRQLALLDAQSTLAIQLKSKIDTSIENYNATKGGGVEAQLATSSELKQKLMVSKDVVGSEIYQSVLSENGVFYVLVGLDEKDTKKVVTQVIEKSMKTDNDLWQKAIPSSSSREELKSDLVAFINEG